MPTVTAALKNIYRVNGSTGELLLYGFIGYEDYNNQELSLTDTNVIQAINELEAAGVEKINVRINSVGGDVFAGSAIVNKLKDAKATICTYVDGVAASMAAIIWASGKKKYMADNASLMIHSASTFAWGNASKLRKTAEMLDVLDSTLMADLTTATGKDKDTIKAELFNGEDHWFNREAAEGYGFKIDKDDDDDDDDDTPDAVAASNQVIQAHAAEMVELARRQMRQIQNSYERMRIAAAASSIPSPNHQDVTVQQLDAALADGTLTVEQVQASLAPYTNTDPAPAPEPTPEPAPAAQASAQDGVIAELQSTIAQLTTQVQNLMEAQGGTPTRVQSPQNTTPSASQGEPDPRYAAVLQLNEEAKDHTQKFV